MGLFFRLNISFFWHLDNKIINHNAMAAYYKSIHTGLVIYCTSTKAERPMTSVVRNS